MPRPVHFEFAVDDPDRAARFWSEAFGWAIHHWEGPQDYWLVSTGEQGPGIDGGLARRSDLVQGGTVLTLDVPSTDEATSKVEAAGGAVVMSKSAVPGVGWLAYCRDTEGTVFGVMENDPSAGRGG